MKSASKKETKDETESSESSETKLNSILSILERQQKQSEAIEERLRQIEKKPRPTPENFKASPEMDENVPSEASRVFRSILGNKIKLKAVEINNHAGMKLVAIIPEIYHTKHQFGEYHLQREVETIKDGKVIEKRIEEYIRPDQRSFPISTKFGTNMLKEVEIFANRVRENILYEFNKSKLPEPNFFE